MGCDKIKIDLVSVIDSFLKVWNVLVCIWWRWHIHKKFSQLRNQNPKEFSSIIKQEDYCQAMLYFLLLLGSSFIWNFLAKILQIFPPQTRHLTTIEIGCVNIDSKLSWECHTRRYKMGWLIFQLWPSISVDRQRHRTTLGGGHRTWKCVQMFLFT